MEPFPEHSQCLVFSSFFRGKLCEQMARRPGRRVAAGQPVYLTGDPARSVFLLRAGLVKTSVLAPRGEELILRLDKAGDVFGELCLCTGERHEQAVALEPSEVVELPLDDLLGRLRLDNKSLLDILAVVSGRLADAYERLRSMSLALTEERLVRTLLKLADDLGQRAPDGLEIGHYITQQELAQLVGARREVVSTHLNQLRQRGLVSYHRKGQIRLSPDALRSHLNELVASCAEQPAQTP
ncbi:MAG TPA: Crp/Fnr family transcriptional regulator [Gemmatimonadales bacterium]|nr:Crp/Fnr family transcriptional regulator [Gemmatimonadales bacterium]